MNYLKMLWAMFFAVLLLAGCDVKNSTKIESKPSSVALPEKPKQPISKLEEERQRNMEIVKSLPTGKQEMQLVIKDTELNSIEKYEKDRLEAEEKQKENTLASPIKEGVEYKCTVAKIFRFPDKNSRGQEVSSQGANPFYIYLKNGRLTSYSKIGASASPTTIDNSIVVSRKVAAEDGMKFSVIELNKDKEDGKVYTQITKDLTEKVPGVTLQFQNIWNNTSAFLITISGCYIN